MSALRESPIRSRPGGGKGMPRWLLVVLVMVGVLVVVAVAYAVFALTRSDEPSAAADPSAAACVSATSIPQSTLPAAKRVHIRVLNATPRQGLAGKVADQLGGYGFDIKHVGNDEVVRKQTGVAEIRYGPKGHRQALLLQYYVPGAELVPDARKTRIVDLALGEAFTSVATQAAADLALQTPVVTQSGAGCPTSAAASQASQPAAPTVAGGSASE